MQSITKTYLAEIIHRVINDTISFYRKSKNTQLYYSVYPSATDDEIVDFIHSIPYFDVRLKDFLLGNIAEENIIISQSWEIEFIKQCNAWATGFEWLHGDDYYMSDAHLSTIKKEKAYLSLPY